MSDAYREDAAIPDLSGMLGALLSNPQALSTVASLLGGAMSRPSDGEKIPPTAAPSEKDTPKALPPPSPRDPRRGLLDALRPYLSPARCEMIDTLLRILELLSLLQRRR